jgi:hypothetical protein
MTLLTLYEGRQKVAQWPITARQVELIAPELRAWATVCGRPRAVLQEGNVLRVIRLPRG